MMIRFMLLIPRILYQFVYHLQLKRNPSTWKDCAAVSVWIPVKTDTADICKSKISFVCI